MSQTQDGRRVLFVGHPHHGCFRRPPAVLEGGHFRRKRALLGTRATPRVAAPRDWRLSAACAVAWVVPQIAIPRRRGLRKLWLQARFSSGRITVLSPPLTRRLPRRRLPTSRADPRMRLVRIIDPRLGSGSGAEMVLVLVPSPRRELTRSAASGLAAAQASTGWSRSTDPSP